MSRLIQNLLRCPTCQFPHELCSHVAARIEDLEKSQDDLVKLRGLLRRLDTRYRKALADAKFFPSNEDEAMLDEVKEALK